MVRSEIRGATSAQPHLPHLPWAKGPARGEIDDLSLAAEDAELAWLASTVEDLKANFDYDALPQHLKDSWDLRVYQYERAQDGAAFRLADYQFDQMNGAQSFLPTLLISFHAVASPLDLEGLINRYGEGGRALNQMIDRAEAAAAQGLETPAFALEGVIEQAEKVVTGAPFTEGDASDLWADFESEVATLLADEQISEEDARRYRQEARPALTESLAPAYARLLTWAKGELPEDKGPVTGLSNRNDDGAYYNYLLRLHTTTKLTADEIHEIGLTEVARLREEMEVIKNEVGFEGDLRAFFDMLRGATGNERFYFPNTDAGRQAYLDEATAAIERIKARLPDYFGILPKADLVVRRVEPFREQDGAAQHYYPAALDGSRPGIYYAHLSDMNAMLKHELEVIAYHEGLPGHHMQIAIAQELEGLPTFRTQTNFNAYAEGWGLYAEWLATEIDGTYLDPYSEFGRLGSEMWRAIRLVVDTDSTPRAGPRTRPTPTSSITVRSRKRRRALRCGAILSCPGKPRATRLACFASKPSGEKRKPPGGSFRYSGLPRHDSRRGRRAPDAVGSAGGSVDCRGPRQRCLREDRQPSRTPLRTSPGRTSTG